MEHYQAISIALQELNGKFDNLANDFRELREAQKPIHQFISESVIKVDRLEQTQKRQRIVVKAAIGAIVASCFAFVGMLIKAIYK